MKIQPSELGEGLFSTPPRKDRASFILTTKRKIKRFSYKSYQFACRRPKVLKFEAQDLQTAAKEQDEEPGQDALEEDSKFQGKVLALPVEPKLQALRAVRQVSVQIVRCGRFFSRVYLMRRIY